MLKKSATPNIKRPANPNPMARFIGGNNSQRSSTGSGSHGSSSYEKIDEESLDDGWTEANAPTPEAIVYLDDDQNDTYGRSSSSNSTLPEALPLEDVMTAEPPPVTFRVPKAKEAHINGNLQSMTISPRSPNSKRRLNGNN